VQRQIDTAQASRRRNNILLALGLFIVALVFFSLTLLSHL